MVFPKKILWQQFKMRLLDSLQQKNKTKQKQSITGNKKKKQNKTKTVQYRKYKEKTKLKNLLPKKTGLEEHFHLGRKMKTYIIKDRRERTAVSIL